MLPVTSSADDSGDTMRDDIDDEIDAVKYDPGAS